MTVGTHTVVRPSNAVSAPRGGLLALVAALALWVAAPPAAAQGPTPPMCTNSVVGVAFGNYSPFTPAPLDSAGSVVFNCNNKAKNIVVTLGPGQSGTFFSRAMRQGAQSLGYNLYLDAARTVVWGDGTGGTSAFTNNNPANDINVVLPVYGRVPAGVDVGVGMYTDTVLATIQF
jgi:spore coat protein U-like protein